MPITREFIYGEDEELGVEGFLPAWMPNGNHTPDVSHDVLEHFIPRDCTPAEDEILALGAMLALRIENGSFSDRYMPYADQLANNLLTVLVDIESYDLPLPRPKASKRLANSDWTESVIQRAVDKAISSLKSELRDYSEEPFVLKDIKALRESCLAYLREGYRKAHRRYQRRDMYTIANTLFKQLSNYSQRVVSSGLLKSGDRVKFNVNTRSLDISIAVNGDRANDWF